MGFEGVSWTGESKPTWYETFEGKAKRGFCVNCDSMIAAIDSDISEIGINVAALDDTSSADFVPVSRVLPRQRRALAAPGAGGRAGRGRLTLVHRADGFTHPFGDPDQDPGPTCR
ncbi:hypothetical protein [Streptomyces sp. NPDC091416]|uniref:hypothetical protein n=1 Tax=Streptomyces sp. NPDC091416 TaxID=3366003 RepID=UPI003815E118